MPGKFHRFLRLLSALHRDPRTPLSWRILVWAAVGYALLPFDLWMDLIPVFGQLDDIAVITLLLSIAFLRVPRSLLRELRNQTHVREQSNGS